MTHEPDPLLLYARTHSEDAFTELVQRYLPLVYASALRRVGGDAHRAEDVTQMVFVALARNASSLSRHPNLTGWLFTTTRFLAAKTLRAFRAGLSCYLLLDSCYLPSSRPGPLFHCIIEAQAGEWE